MQCNSESKKNIKQHNVPKVVKQHFNVKHHKVLNLKYLKNYWTFAVV